MVDTGAEHSVVTQKVAPLSGKEVTIFGATGDQTCRPFCRPRRCQLGGHQVIHEFLYLPDCPVPLMGRDLLAKMGAEITFAPDSSAQLCLRDLLNDPVPSSAKGGRMETLYRSVKGLTIRTELEKEFLLVWVEENPPGLAKDHAPVLINLKPGAQPVKISQYPIPREAPRNPGLRAVNEAVITLHSALPYPYNLLGLIPSDAEWFTCLDLKDAFFCLRLAPSSQPLFAFEWENSTTGAKEQFTWTRLPQGFKNSPPPFSGALASDLFKFPGQDLGSSVLGGNTSPLRLLTEIGYRVSKKKVQICQKEVKLGTERKQAVCAIPVPCIWQQIREFLGASGFCLIWIPGFSDLAKPLYEALKGEEKAPIDWGPEQEKAFTTIKAKLTKALALGLSDVMQDFNPFVHENSGVALGVLTQEFGPWQRPVAYLPKQTDPVASGWPPCLRAFAAMALLVKEVDKLSLGQNLNVKVPHAVVTLMEIRRLHWLTHVRMTQYQGLLCENPRVRLEAVRTLNPSTFLPIIEGDPEHDCLEVLEEVYCSQLDLRQKPYKIRTWYCAQTMPAASKMKQKAALVRALELSKNKLANIYTDLRYAFATLHIHGAIYKELGFLMAGGKGIKNQNDILKLLEAVWEPKEIAVIHCKGHQKGKDLVSEGNRRADAATKLVAKEQVALSRIMLAPNYLNLQNTLLRKRNGLGKKGAGKEGRLSCLLCAQNNAKQGPVGPIGVSVGNRFRVLAIGFAGSRHIPTHTEKAREVTKALLKDIITRYGMPLTIRSDNGPAFEAEIVQQVAKALGIKWNLHTAYRPQSSGKVECMNRTRKQALAKLCQATTLPWTDILPLVLLWVLYAPRARIGFSPFEILYGRPPPLIQLKGDLGEIGNLEIQKLLQGLGKLSLRWVTDRLPISLGTAVHPYKPGDQVWVKDWKKEPLKPTWKGPYSVILTTPTALKVAGLNNWIHHSRVKAAHQPSDAQPEWKVTADQKQPLQITLKRMADLSDQPAARNSETPC
ncbi:LOW QUALITY PROTEIN: hypothetical protein QTO34_008006 [Cnephaeus nilssonii]|uniref:Gag-Pol polyprotein n=1 Tax=Cnephaeus nilssonii TaxID=3371016 RepID=A0AA40I9I4_CNENI|nr:LOW QUALITY PROTEIN: hypothetical protein QTO34_008006 [Eptesicus nilssonii]